MGVLGVSAGLLLCVPALPVGAGGRVVSRLFCVAGYCAGGGGTGGVGGAGGGGTGVASPIVGGGGGGADAASRAAMRLLFSQSGGSERLRPSHTANSFPLSVPGLRMCSGGFTPGVLWGWPGVRPA